MSNYRDYPEIILFATYVAIADQKIYDQEWFRIEENIILDGHDSSVRNSALSIVKDLPEKRKLDDIVKVLSKAPIEIKKRALYLAYQVAYEDGALTDKEDIVFQKYKFIFNIDKKTQQAIQNEARISVEEFHSLKNIGGTLDERYTDCMFSTENYSKIIEQLSQVARTDIELSREKLITVENMLKRYPELIVEQTNKIVKSEKHINNPDERKALLDFFEDLHKQINISLESEEKILEELREKQTSSACSYTISFMGRTKAGKSTLHSILLGGLNNDFIGRGAERTTRYNYIYDFHGLRIIDTPGIGAPGGQGDVAIAEDVLDESDLICYVVTSDSVQETEFEFLRKIKERNKPVIILLNKKDNFARSEKKKKQFIENPLLWYETDGEDSIQGHIDRINTYITKNHEYRNYEIVPVHLLAAKMALSEKDEAIKEKLMIGSRIREFLSLINETVSKYGVLIKSQTIYNASIYHLIDELRITKEQIDSLRLISEEISRNSTDGFNQIESYGIKIRNEIIESFNAQYEIFLSDEVKNFAYENYGMKKKDLPDKWREFLKQTDIENRFMNAYESGWNKYQQKVDEVLVDIEEDINFSLELGLVNNIRMKGVFDVGFLLRTIGAIVGVVGIFFVATPVGWILLGVGTLFEIAQLFVKSKKRQIEDAKSTLYDSLCRDLEEIRCKNLNKLLKQYDESREMNLSKIRLFYDVIEKNMNKLADKLSELFNVQKNSYNELNKAYATRLAKYITRNNYYDVKNIYALNEMKVERIFGKEIVIIDENLYIHSRVVSPEEISEILQEKVILRGE